MSETETETPLGSDARASARRHTTQLLKMLRGYGPVAASEPVTKPKPTVVAEATVTYARLLETVPGRPSLSSPAMVPPSLPCPSPCRRGDSGSIPAVGEVLGRQPGMLGRLMARADRLTRYTQIFRAYLPPHLLDHAVLVQLDQDNWTVHTDSASWATRLRYALHNIRSALGQQLGIPLPKPRIRVMPSALSPRRSRRPRLTLTERNAQLLEVTARNVPDARLSAALRRLATHIGPFPDPHNQDS